MGDWNPFMDLAQNAELAPAPRAPLPAIGDPKQSAIVSVAQLARENIDDVRRVYTDAIAEGQPLGLRLKAARELVEFDLQAERLAMDRSSADFDAMNKAELAQSIVEMLGNLQRKGLIEVEQIVDAEVIEP